MNYLFAAYAAIWIILVVYVMGLWRKQRRLAEDLEVLRKQVEKLEP